MPNPVLQSKKPHYVPGLNVKNTALSNREAQIMGNLKRQRIGEEDFEDSDQVLDMVSVQLISDMLSNFENSIINKFTMQTNAVLEKVALVDRHVFLLAQQLNTMRPGDTNQLADIFENFAKNLRTGNTESAKQVTPTVEEPVSSIKSNAPSTDTPKDNSNVVHIAKRRGGRKGAADKTEIYQKLKLVEEEYGEQLRTALDFRALCPIILNYIYGHHWWKSLDEFKAEYNTWLQG